MKYLRNIFFTLMALITIIFIIQNYQDFSRPITIRLDLYFITLETPAIQSWVLFLMAFFVGVVLASIGGLFERMRLKGEVRDARREAQKLKEELNSLRNLPITEEPVPTVPAPVTTEVSEREPSDETRP